MQGNADEDKLIAAAKAVAAHTAQLLLACQVKADPRSENNRRLQVQCLLTYMMSDLVTCVAVVRSLVLLSRKPQRH